MGRFPALRIGRLRLDRLAILGLGAVLLLTLAAATAAAGLKLVRPGSLPGIEVAGIDVGGLPEEELRAALTQVAAERGREHVRVVRSATAGRPARASSTPRGAMGYRFDVEATADAVLSRGRQGNPFVALWDHARASVATTSVAPVESIDDAAFRRWAARTARRLSVPPREGDLRIEETRVEAMYPVPGAVIDEHDLARRARRRLLEGRREFTVAPEEAAPATDAADVDRVATAAERALSEPVTLTHNGAAVTFSPEDIGSALAVRVADGDLRLRLRGDKLRGSLSEAEIASIESEPVDATFRLAGDSVEIVPSSAGVAFDPPRAARKVLELATGRGARQGTLPGRRVSPAFSTRDARALDITERVSSFTTYHPCCEPRVSNIHRIADLVDGVVVEPGQAFSLNGHVGPRTTASGFVAAPAIRDGEFVEEVGGGISQFATTMFNAIYFGGYDFTEYQPHSYYIDRYPMGREATISTPAPDLAFVNDSDAGIYIATSYSDTSITVTFYGSTDVEVRSETGVPYNHKPAPRECRTNRTLRKGEERVISEGRAGFDVVVRRILIEDGEQIAERFFTRYNPEPRIVERRRCRG